MLGTLDYGDIQEQIRFATNFVDAFKDVEFKPRQRINVADTFHALGYADALEELQEQPHWLSGREDDFLRAEDYQLQLMSGRNVGLADDTLAGRPTYGLEVEFLTQARRNEVEGMLNELGAKYVYDTSIGIPDDETRKVLYEGRGGRFRGYDEPGIPSRIERQFGLENIFFGGEMASGILQGEEGLENVREIVQRLNDLGAFVNETTGTHVHVGAKRLTRRNIANIYGGFAAREPLIDMVHAPSRRGNLNRYAQTLLRDREDRPITLSQLQEQMESGIGGFYERLFGEHRRTEGYRYRNFPDRYGKLNVHGYKGQTLEFRQQAGTLDIDEIEKQIRFAVNFVEQFKDRRFVASEAIEPTSELRALGYADFAGRMPSPGVMHTMGLLPERFVEEQDRSVQLFSGRDPNARIQELADRVMRGESVQYADDIEANMVRNLVEQLTAEEAAGFVDTSEPQPTRPSVVDEMEAANRAAAAASQAADPMDFYEEIPPDFFAGPDPTQGTQADVARGKPSPFGFTPEQQRAIGHGKGPGLVIAGPGAGKTAVLRERMFNLVQGEGVEAHRILTLAFNKAAATELYERSKDIGDVDVRTVHGMARQVVKDNLEELGMRIMPQVLDEGDRLEGFSRRLMGELSDTGQVDERKLSRIIQEINLARAQVSEGLFDPEVLAGDAKTFAIAYEQFKAESRQIDFQDMLLYAADLLDRSPRIRDRYRGRFDFIQIDEFQDVSEADFRFLQQFGENLFAVGDDDQTIYSFRSGAGTVMRDFRSVAEGQGSVYDVVKNFRSTPEIVDAARGVIEGAKERFPKDLQATRESLDRPLRHFGTDPTNIQEILQQQLIPDTETAILTRTNEEAGVIQNMLRDMPEDIRGSVAQVGTLHGAKGLEYDRVIMILNTLADRSGGLLRTFPSAVRLEELEEERRLFYVGMTRAKDELILMGKSTEFLDELGLPDELAPDIPDVEDIEAVTTEAVEASRTFRQRMERGFHEFRARYQKLRTYQDMVDMERLGDVPTGEIVENLSFAQVQREKIEELGRDLGIDPASRTDKPTPLRGMDRFLANLHRPGKIQIAGYGGLVGADLSGATRGLGLGPRTALGLGTAALTKTFRAIDEFLYPHARRPGQQLDYRELHHPLPETVSDILPEDIDPRNFRLIEQLSDDYYKPKFYEFAHPTEGWEGDAFERPLFFEGGFQMERLRSLEEMEAVRDEGLLSDKYTYLDTSQPSSGLRITPYDPLAQDTLYRPPAQQRTAREISQSAIEYMENMRNFIEDSRTGTRRPSLWRSPGRRLRWEREHRRLLRPALGTGVDRFLTDNRTRDIVDFEQLHRVLTRLNPENARISMGMPFGSHDMAAQTIGLHNEVLDYLEQVRDPASPYFGAPTDIMAGGRLHQLPDGREGTADPDGIPRVDAPRFTMGQRARELFRRDRFRSPLRRFRAGDQLERAGLMIQTYDELGQKVRPGSGVYLGQGRVATALHTQLPLEYEEGMRTPTRATVQSVRGGKEIDVTGFLDFDEQLDLAILNLDQTNKAIKELESVPLGRGWIGRGRGLRTMGAGQFLSPGDPGVSADPLMAGEQTRIRLPFSTEGLRGSVAEGIGRLERTPEQIAQRELNVFPVQSGSGVFSRGFFGDRLQGIIGGRSADHQGFFYPAQMVRRLLGRRAGVGGYQDVVSQFTPDTEGVITRAVKSRLDPLSVGDRDRRAYQLLTAREQYIGEYTPEVSELESRLYDIQAAGALDTEGLEELGQIHTRLAEIQRPLQGEEGIDAEIRKALGPDTPTNIADIDPRIYSRSYGLGQRFQDTGIGGRLGRGVRATGDFLGSPGMRKLGRGLAKTGRFLGKTGIPVFEVLDFMDKVDYFTGGSTRRITQEAVETGDLDQILSRYELLQQERAFHTTGGGLDVVGRLLGTGATAFEEDYFEREGGLRDIGSWWSGLEWAERLPVVDPFLTAVDKIEKGVGGRMFDAISDPTGRLVTSEVDVQMGQLQELLTYKRGALTRGQQERLDTALTGQRAALTTELGGLPAYDREQVAQRRADIESEIQRINESEDKMVRVVGGMGRLLCGGCCSV